MKIVGRLLNAVRSASVFNPEVQVAPTAILWPDHDRQWEAVIPLLQAELSEMFVLGDYAPEKRIGPAIWLRCVIAGQIEGGNLPADRTPIIYLPGVSRQDLRAIEACPDRLKPLAELQYRGTIWSQINAKDWTILAFLKSDQGGLGLDVAQDNATKNVMKLALHRLLDEKITLLRSKRLDKNFFNTLLTGGDPVRDLLQWLDQGNVFKNNREMNEWQAFADVCKTQFVFDPENDGQLAGGNKLADHEGPWNAVWERYCEAPKRYPQISSLLRKCQTPTFDLFTNAATAGGWPQWNDGQEACLRNDLLALGKLPSHEVRNKIIELEKTHADRRELVWAELGEAPLAKALEPLALLAETTRQSLAAGTLADMAAGYRSQGWQADDALLNALAQVENDKDLSIISSAIRSLYLPWAEEAARYLQEIWKNYPPTKVHGLGSGPVPDCVVFVDGLRFDCARRLISLLERQGLTVDAVERWAALPSVTGTGKPAVAPLIRENVIAEEPEPYNFAPLTPHQFKKALNHNGWHILGKKEAVPAPDSLDSARLWVECGNLDHEGHDRGWKLARQMDLLLGEIGERIAALVDAGWSKIRIVTDHGWLLLPGGLPKTDLPSSVAETKWGRCAVIKPGASSNGLEIPWHWNPNQHFVLADGIGCFRKGEEYTHGGISLQECLTLELTVTGKGGSSTLAVSITDVVWKGLRCTIATEDQFAGLSLDIRLQPGNPDSSIVAGVKAVKENGTASVVIEDGDLEGSAATLVLIDETGKLMAQVATVIGGGGE